ncbi:HK97 gp10 family phage protein [Paenibacillus abyssi]|nr:HK97 gp10 family phage protein [Paenibacillus abyssi]
MRTKITGLREMRGQSREISKEFERQIDNEVEKAALRVVNGAREEAPRDTGQLANSISVVDAETKMFERTVGTDLPYAAIQEFEHATKRGFLRKSLFNERTQLRKALRKLLGKGG